MNWPVFVATVIGFWIGVAWSHYRRVRPLTRLIEEHTTQMKKDVARLREELEEQKVEMETRLAEAIGALQRSRRSQATYRTPGGEA